MYYILFIDQLMHFGLFPHLGYYDDDVMNIYIYIFVWTCVFISLGEIPKSGNDK